MENFNYYNPVKLFFGKGKLSELKAQMPVHTNILVTYGGGSIKQNGIYNQVLNELKEFQVVEFGGIEPNPKFETCMKAVDVIQKNNVGFILAVGGGSVIDGSKFIAAAARFQGNDPWDILSKHAPVIDALPLGCVLTLPATGTEMNGNSVISRESTLEKLAFGSPLVLPKFSILDPVFTYSLPARQVSNGVVDAFVHIMEQYLTYPVNSPVQDRFAEGLLLTLIEEGPKALQTTIPDYDNRANIMWAATMALNGLIGLGVKSDWATHTIGHELTAIHGLDHAVTLAIVLPGLLWQTREKRYEKLAQFARRVWHIDIKDDHLAGELAIQKTEAFFRTMGMKTKLSEHQIGKGTIETIVKRFEKRGYKKMGNQQDIQLSEISQLLMHQY